ncbi:protein max isoform X5 [Muntiacus reevesi]|uniref:protein max isoform X5 n=1 Tax=Muntiacus reevesi TaxID=9886 RepID=UPI003306BC5D
MSDNDDIEVESDADKRAHHNALERKRRDHIKDSFHSLRDSVPSLQGEKASRAQILDKATEYIQYMRRKNHTHQQDIDDLKRQNALLEQQGVSLVVGITAGLEYLQRAVRPLDWSVLWKCQRFQVFRDSERSPCQR